MVHKELELGVFEIGSIKKAKADLIAAGDESLQISDDGKRKRAASEASRDLAPHCARLKRRLILRGLLHTSDDGPDTPFHDEDLLRDFQTLAFLSEYVSGQSFQKGKAQPANLSKWIASPVRVYIFFGPFVPMEKRAVDTETIKTLLQRLSKITRHPTYLVEENSTLMRLSLMRTNVTQCRLF